MTPPILRSTFVATQHTHELLCRLLGEYKSQSTDTVHTLALLKLELGDLEFENFQADLRKLMQTRTAVSAVKEMISRSVERRAKPPIAQEVRVPLKTAVSNQPTAERREQCITQMERKPKRATSSSTRRNIARSPVTRASGC